MHRTQADRDIDRRQGEIDRAAASDAEFEAFAPIVQFQREEEIAAELAHPGSDVCGLLENDSDEAQAALDAVIRYSADRDCDLYDLGHRLQEYVKDLIAKKAAVGLDETVTKYVRTIVEEFA